MVLLNEVVVISQMDSRIVEFDLVVGQEDLLALPLMLLL